MMQRWTLLYDAPYADTFSPQNKNARRPMSICLNRLYQPSGVHLIGEFGLRGSHWI
jgi:hypothetical protein